MVSRQLPVVSRQLSGKSKANAGPSAPLPSVAALRMTSKQQIPRSPRRPPNDNNANKGLRRTLLESCHSCFNLPPAGPLLVMTKRIETAGSLPTLSQGRRKDGAALRQPQGRFLRLPFDFAQGRSGFLLLAPATRTPASRLNYFAVTVISAVADLVESAVLVATR